MEDIFGWMLTPQGWITLGTLAFLEIVLGIDNVIFVSIAASKLPEQYRAKARQIGLFLAMFLRIALLTILTWLAGLTTPLFEFMGHGFSTRDLILAGGGIYLIYKASIEIIEMLHVDHVKKEEENSTAQAAVLMVIAQIAIVDVVFAVDSIVTAIGMTNQLPIMITAVVISVMVMMFSSGIVAKFVEENPSTKMLALVFLVLVGGILVIDAFGHHIDRSYVNSIIIFSVVVEALNVFARKAMDREIREKITKQAFEGQENQE